MALATTPSGQPIVRDGCHGPVETVTGAMKNPVPREIRLAAFGKDNSASG
ncbi:hypothetical protein ABZU76_38565 [Amycolatopsis sp. NPDC005232]